MSYPSNTTTAPSLDKTILLLKQDFSASKANNYGGSQIHQSNFEDIKCNSQEDEFDFLLRASFERNKKFQTP